MNTMLALIDGHGELYAGWFPYDGDVEASLARCGYTVLSIYCSQTVVSAFGEVFTVKRWNE